MSFLYKNIIKSAKKKKKIHFTLKNLIFFRLNKAKFLNFL